MAAVGDLVRSTTRGWMVRPPERCPHLTSWGSAIRFTGQVGLD
ncbi:hypothetical protein [Mycobacterium sp.]